MSLSLVTYGCVSLSGVGIKAEEVQLSVIPVESINAFSFWESYGFSLEFDNFQNIETVAFKTTGTDIISATSGTLSGCISVPQNVGSGTAGNLTTGCTYNQTGDMYMTFSSQTESINENSTGTITSNLSYQYAYPKVKASSIIQKTQYASNQNATLQKGEIKYYGFMSRNWRIQEDVSNIQAYLRPADIPNGFAVKISKVELKRFGRWYVNLFSVENISDVYGVYSLYFNDLTISADIIPIFCGNLVNMTEVQRSIFGLPNATQQEIINTNSILEQQHEEVMATDEISNLSDVADASIDSGTDKFNNLLYPIKWIAEEAQALSEVDASGTITLPGVFTDDTWVLDLRFFELNLPSAWVFIQSVCRLAVASYIMMGLFNLFRGSDSA